jgi:acyl transferase domain-containing protein
MTSSSGFCAPEPIAVIGFALKFPQEVTHEEALWKLLVEKRSTMTDVPPGRWNSKGFYKPEGKAPGTVSIPRIFLSHHH